MKFILGKKIEMSQRFKDDGTVVPVTIIKAGPCTVTQVKSSGDKDGYSAVQIGFEAKKKLKKPLAGHLKGLDQSRYLKEFRVEKIDDFKRGQKLDVSQFSEGDHVLVSGTSKGKGFQGVVKRHHFSGSPGSHGHKDQLRMPGSIGSSEIAHVFKGTRMAGHMGNEKVSINNLEIVEVNKEKNLIVVKGAVPGARNSLLIIRSLKDA